ncbi:MAG: methionyl-tRNA formyltransferase [Chloroflexota bacterium]|nr:methionyl-tRNA formyltransferase [Chloroflexota bacterium]
MSGEKIVFMGSPDYAIPVLRMLHEQFNLTAVITQPDQPVGRGKKIQSPPVKTVAEELGLPVYQPVKAKGPEFMALLENLAPDVMVVAAYGNILREEVLNFPRFGCVNVHASLLPRWRGASPIRHAILHGDAQSGVTIMKMDRGVDTGPIFEMKAVPIRADDTADTLTEKLAKAGADLLAEVLPRYLAGEISAHPQPEEGATYAHLLKKQDGALDFSKSAEELERRVRAFNPWPMCTMDWKGLPLRVLQAAVSEHASSQPGKRNIIDKFPAVGTASTDLKLLEVQPAGKKAMRGTDFLNGARDWAD